MDHVRKIQLGAYMKDLSDVKNSDIKVAIDGQS